ncbi:MAG TPA: fumarylacetoacetate hydrolase family protein [Actinomycetota bacterium]|nr:fumarylacetoacetate hydrolase family protein [Actinomycetota bacterium]
MRIFRYADPAHGRARLAVAAPGRSPIELDAAWLDAGGDDEPFLRSTLALIEAGPSVWQEVASIAEASNGPQVAGMRWLCPFDRVPSLRDFLAFEDHVRRGAQRRGTPIPDYWFEAPIYYKGNHRSLIGPDDPCPWPSYTNKLDLELELAMVVGRRARDLSTEDAPSMVFGFTIFNDFSARDIQAREVTAWLGPGKGKDFANSFGPCIVTADEVGTEPDLEMICRVNGEEWGRARSSSIHWKWADMLAHVSRSEDVWPGDVYGSGTPGGCCGLDLDRFLEPGDVVELEIERIGVLRNTIGDRPRDTFGE